MAVNPEKVEKVDLDTSTKNGEDWQEVTEETISPDEEKKLLRKIDLSLLPVMSLVYLFQFLDKTAIQQTAILGLREDLSLTGQDFSWSAAIYYIGYLLAAYPFSWLMVRWKVGKTLTTAIIIWGASVMLAAAAFNAAGLLAARFFLGIFEAPIAPGLTIVVSMWYKRSEQPLRHAAWFLGNSIGGILGGILAYGIGHIQSVSPWKAVFAIYGGATVFWGILSFWLLPDTPMTAYFLSKSDREKAVARVRENLTGIKSDEFKWDQFWEALTDVKTWLLFCIQLGCNIPNGGISTFKSIIIKGFGFGTGQTLLLTSVAYVLQIILVLLATGGSTYFHNTRTYWMVWNSSIAITGASMVYALPQELQWARFAGITLSGAYAANFPLMMSLLSGNVGGFTKKTTVSAIIFIGFCGGNIIGPQLFFAWESPRYTSAFLGMMTCLSIGLILSLVMRFYLMWENKRRDARDANESADSGPQLTNAELNQSDQTDQKMRQFRYVY